MTDHNKTAAVAKEPTAAEAVAMMSDKLLVEVAEVLEASMEDDSMELGLFSLDLLLLVRAEQAARA